jgi:branched-chain amino acid transport system permease protein
VTKFFQTLMDGAAVGSLYALIALGYTMVYGTLQFINFAHSDVFVLGAWVSYTLAVGLGFALAGSSPPAYGAILILLAAMVCCGAAGFTIERLAYRPCGKAPRLNVLITAIGVSLFLQNVGQLKWIFGTQPQRMPSLIEDRIIGTLAGVQIHVVDVIGVVTALALMLVLDWLIFRTRLGRAMRAVSHDTNVAALMGINVDAVISFTFVLGSSLAAAAGFLYAMKYPG